MKKIHFVHFYLVGKTVLEELKDLNLAVEILGSYLPATAQYRPVDTEDQRKVNEAWIEYQEIAARQRDSEHKKNSKESKLESSLSDRNPGNALDLCLNLGNALDLRPVGE